MSGGSFPECFYITKPITTKTVLLVSHSSNAEEFKANWNTRICTEKLEKPKNSTLEIAPYNDNDEGILDCMDLEDTYEVVPTNSGQYLTSFHVPSVFIRVIIGPKGTKLRELQQSTQTVIKVPRKNDEEVFIKIFGPTERSVVSARNQIVMLTLAQREKLPNTHFVSIHCFTEEIKQNFLNFKKEILDGPPTRGITEDIFQNVDKLHMTIVMLAVLDEFELDHVKQIVEKNVKNLLSRLSNACEFLVQGVEIMNDDPTEVNVLYAKVEPTDATFQTVANKIQELFEKNGYVKKLYDNVKLHMTLMNSTFGKIQVKRNTFDASYILKKYAHFYFGKMPLKNIDLSIRYTTAKNGYYNFALTIPVSN